MSQGRMLLAALSVLLMAGCGSNEPTSSGPPLPTGIVLGSLSSTPQRGMQTGTAYSDACAAGEVVIGYRGASALSAAGFLGQIQALCGSVGVSGGSSPTVQVTTGSITPIRGTLSHTQWTASCPTNQVVVGFGGRNGDLIDRLVFRCAPLVIGLQGGSWAIAVGSASDLAAVGGTGGLAFAQTDCATGTIATVSDIRAASIPEGGVAISAFGLGCRPPSLQFP